ncbi:MAG: carboxypeptidase regulatory-like domain-containing protein [Planctomycetes bacterium]|nr:carboxypeptidase regulatory-like domain-containing protein [Planctomycetota bacterium]
MRLETRPRVLLAAGAAAVSLLAIAGWLYRSLDAQGEAGEGHLDTRKPAGRPHDSPEQGVSEEEAGSPESAPPHDSTPPRPVFIRPTKKGAKLAGLVLFYDHTPAHGATVIAYERERARHPDESDRYDESAHTTTDGRGRWSLTLDDEGEYLALACWTKAGDLVAYDHVTVSKTIETELSLVFDEPAAIDGVVRDQETDVPIAGVDVDIENPLVTEFPESDLWPYFVTVSTDAGGRFAFPFVQASARSIREWPPEEPLKCGLVFKHPEYEVAWGETFVDPGRTTRHDIKLRRKLPPTSLVVHVAGEEGEPVSGAIVSLGYWLEYSGGSGPATIAYAWTDSSGTVRLEGEANHRVFEPYPGDKVIFELYAGASGYQIQKVIVDSIKPADSGSLSIVLKKGLVISGRVIDSEASEPIAGLEASARAAESPWRFWGPVEGFENLERTKTDENGEFVFDCLSEGEYEIRIRSSRRLAGGRNSNKFQAGTTGIELRLLPDPFRER